MVMDMSVMDCKKERRFLFCFKRFSPPFNLCSPPQRRYIDYTMRKETKQNQMIIMTIIIIIKIITIKRIWFIINVRYLFLVAI